MKTNAHIQAIYIAASAGARMQSLPYAEVLAGHGILGDRYASASGAYSNTKPPKIRHISLITQTGIAIANEWLEGGNELPFTNEETRRNIVLQDMTPDELNHLVGQTFQIGNISMRGTELCAPCHRPADLLSKSGFMDAFEGRGGLRAELLSSGMLSIGDRLKLIAKDADD